MTYAVSQWRPGAYDSDNFMYDGFKFYASSEYAYSLSSPDNNTMRFEVRKGDRLDLPGWTDEIGSERSEMTQSSPRYTINSEAGKHFSIEYKFMVEPGAKNTAKWLVMGQLHSGMNKAGPFNVAFRNDDKMQLLAMHDNGETVLFKDTQDIVRGKWYTMKIDLQFGPSGDGHIAAWRDGAKIADYHGKVGYSDQVNTWWNMGIYRNSPPGGETTAIQFKDIDLTYGADGHSDTAHTLSPNSTDRCPHVEN